MNNAKGIIVVLTVAVIASVTALWTVERQTQVRLRGENESLQRQLERMVQLETDNVQLSNIVAQADGSRSNQQLMELLKLRNEVGMLRRQTSEFQKLREQNEQLQTAIKAGNGSQFSPTTNLPPAAPPLAVYPKASWAFAGYATPEDAFQSLNWAAFNGDIATLRANLTPDMQKEFAKQFENKSETDVADEIKNQFKEKTEVRVLTKDVISDNLVVLGVVGDEKEAGAKHNPDKLVFQRIDGQWKLASDH
jgi:hypothetical protein